jgi:hypothetical protein
MPTKKQPNSPRENLIDEISSQFPEINLVKGEDVEKDLTGLIVLTDHENITEDNDKIINSNNSLHPKLEILIEKFDAKVSTIKKSDDSIDFVIIPDYMSKKQSKKESGFLILKEILKKFKS